MSKENPWVILSSAYRYESEAQPDVIAQGTSVFSVSWKQEGRTATLYPGASWVLILSPKKEEKPHE